MIQDLYIKGVAAGGGSVGAKILKTNQTVSYATDDDGDFESGRDVDFFTLPSNNPFSNTLRYTDELGGTTYTNGIVIDWSTYDGATVLGFRKTNNGVDIDWANSITDAAAISIGTFTSGWRLPNVKELLHQSNYTGSGGKVFGSAPLAEANNVRFWSSTTWSGVTTYGVCVPNRPFESMAALKTTTANFRYYPCRNFTVTGTTLT